MIKDLRKTNENINVKEIKKQAFIEAYEEILSANVVMAEEEFKKTIKESINKVKEEFKKVLGEKYDLVEEAIKNESKINLYTKTELTEEYDSLIKEAVGEENFKTLDDAIKENQEIFILAEDEIKEAEDIFLEKLDEKIKEAIGEENFKLLEKAINEGEEVYLLTESIIPSIEEKMITKIKESLNIDEASKEDDYQESIRQQIIQNADLYNQAKEAENEDQLKEIICGAINGIDCEDIDWVQLHQDLNAVDEECKHKKENESVEPKTLAEKLIDEGIESTDSSNEETSTLVEKLI